METRLKLAGAIVAIVLGGFCLAYFLVLRLEGPNGPDDQARLAGADKVFREGNDLVLRAVSMQATAVATSASPTAPEGQASLNAKAATLLTRAEGEIRKALQTYTDVLGPRSLQHTEALLTLAMLERARGKAKEAVDFYTKALVQMDSILEDAPEGDEAHRRKLALLQAKTMALNCQRCLWGLTILYQDEGRKEEALATRRTIALLEEDCKKKNDFDIPGALRRLAAILRDVGCKDEAARVEARARARQGADDESEPQ